MIRTCMLPKSKAELGDMIDFKKEIKKQCYVCI